MIGQNQFNQKLVPPLFAGFSECHTSRMPSCHALGKSKLHCPQLGICFLILEARSDGPDGNHCSSRGRGAQLSGTHGGSVLSHQDLTASTRSLRDPSGDGSIGSLNCPSVRSLSFRSAPRTRATLGTVRISMWY
jgi:hypothetical protein